MGCGVPWRAVVPWWRMAWRIAVEVACVVYTVELVLLERCDDAPLRALLVVGVHLLELQDRQRQVRRALAHGRKGMGAWASSHWASLHRLAPLHRCAVALRRGVLCIAPPRALATWDGVGGEVESPARRASTRSPPPRPNHRSRLCRRSLR